MQVHQRWVIPAIQSIHILGIAAVMGSVLMIELRILGWGGRDQTLGQTASRFGRSLSAALWLMLATGLLMVIAEPVRELVTFSFWAKMCLIAIEVLALALLRARTARRDQSWEDRISRSSPIKIVALLTLFVWLAVIVLGRLIAYDHVWGAWSPARTQ